MKQFEEYRVHVHNEEESKQVQEKAFQLGYRWITGRKQMHLDKIYLFFWYDGDICHSNRQSTFEESEFKEMSVKQFLEL